MKRGSNYYCVAYFKLLKIFSAILNIILLLVRFRLSKDCLGRKKIQVEALNCTDGNKRNRLEGK